MGVSFDFVNSRIATGGGIASESDLDALHAAGITHIVDCRDDVDDLDLLAFDGRFGYLPNGTADDGKLKSPEWFAKTINFVLPLLSLRGSKIYLHCQAGVNRGPSSAFAVLLALGYSPALARAEITVHRLRTLVGLRYADDAEAAVKYLGWV